MPLLMIVVQAALSLRKMARRGRWRQEVVGIVSVELEAGAGAGVRVPLLDGVVQAAGGVDDGHGSVFEAVHLVQPAGLVARRHEEDIGAGFDLVREHLIEADVDGDLAGKRVRRERKQTFVVGLAGAERDQKTSS